VRGSARIDVRVRGRYNPTLNYQHYMVPGILVALVTMIGTLLSAQNIAREKELGTLEQLNVTPITRGEFIVAKLLPFWVLGLLELALGLVVGKLVFDIPMRGSVPLLFASATVYLAVALGIGLWIFLARRNAAAGDVCHLLHRQRISADERPLHADRQHGTVGACGVRDQPRSALRDHLACHSDERGRPRGDRAPPVDSRGVSPCHPYASP
jgi:hypothetical protein